MTSMLKILLTNNIAWLSCISLQAKELEKKHTDCLIHFDTLKVFKYIHRTYWTILVQSSKWNERLQRWKDFRRSTKCFTWKFNCFRFRMVVVCSWCVVSQRSESKFLGIKSYLSNDLQGNILTPVFSLPLPFEHKVFSFARNLFRIIGQDQIKKA